MRFAIIASPRTGSSHLVAMLNREPDIFCNAEAFHRRKPFLHWPKRDLTPELEAELFALRAGSPLDFLELVFSRNYGRQHVGFKIFANHNDLVLDKIIMERTIRKIVLYRRNVLANYASEMSARATGNYALKTARLPRPQVHFDREQFIRFHDRYNAFYRSSTERLNHSGQQFFFLEYETLNSPHIFSALLKFIEAAGHRENLREVSRRKGNVNILSRFSNSDEVQSFLLQEGLMSWSHEGELSLGDLGVGPQISGVAVPKPATEQQDDLS